MLQLNFSPFPVLVTERLLLSQVTVENSNEIFALRTDESVNRYLDRIKARSLGDAIKFIQKTNNSIANNESIYWGINLKDERKVIGTACIWNISHAEQTAEIGYELLPACQGKGLMMEALQAVIGYGFESMKLAAILAVASPENDRSANLLRKLGFTRDAEKEKQLEEQEEYGGIVVYSTRSIEPSINTLHNK